MRCRDSGGGIRWLCCGIRWMDSGGCGGDRWSRGRERWRDSGGGEWLDSDKGCGLSGGWWRRARDRRWISGDWEESFRGWLVDERRRNSGRWWVNGCWKRGI